MKLFAKKEDVDLGYTNPIKRLKKVEAQPEEKKEEPVTEVKLRKRKLKLNLII